MENLERCARELLRRLDSMTSEEFAHGAERPEREALRAALDESAFASTMRRLERSLLPKVQR